MPPRPFLFQLFSISAFAPVVSSLQLPFLGSTNGTRFSQAPNGGSGLRIAIGKGFVMVENLFRDYPPGEPPWHRSPFFIRVIRAIRGSNCCEWIA